MKFEIVKFFGKDFERETFESLCERKASDLEFALSGFIKVYEQPEHSKREDLELTPFQSDPNYLKALGHDFVNVGCTDHTYCTRCGEEDHVIAHTLQVCDPNYEKRMEFLKSLPRREVTDAESCKE